MRILLIHPHDIFSAHEPWAIRIFNIARELKKLRNEVKIIYFPFDWHNGILPKEIEGIPVIPLSRRISPLVFLRNIVRVFKIAKWAEVIHFQKCFHWGSLPAIFAAYLQKKPLHYDWDDWEEKIFADSNAKPFLPVRIFLNLLERFLPELTDTVSVSSDALRNICLKIGIKAGNIFTANVGADLEKFNPFISADGIRKKYNLEGKIIFYHGQLHGAQYARIFIRAAKYIQDNYVGVVSFMVVGDGSKRQKLVDYAESLNLKNIVFTGAVVHHDVPKYIISADICVAPFEDNEITRAKSPLKLAEYLACGKPVVASDVGEANKMVSGAGLLAKPGDALSLAENVIALLQDEFLCEGFSKLARERAQKIYNWATTANNLNKAYQKAIFLK